MMSTAVRYLRSNKERLQSGQEYRGGERRDRERRRQLHVGEKLIHGDSRQNPDLDVGAECL